MFICQHCHENSQPNEPATMAVFMIRKRDPGPGHFIVREGLCHEKCAVEASILTLVTSTMRKQAPTALGTPGERAAVEEIKIEKGETIMMESKDTGIFAEGVYKEEPPTLKEHLKRKRS